MSPSVSTNKIRWLLLFSWTLAIFIFSTDSFSDSNTSGIIVSVLKWLVPSISPEGLHIGNVICRKAGHVLEYFALGMLAWRAFDGEAHEGKSVWIRAAAWVLVVALTDEFHQSFVPSRTASIVDVGYDFLGGITGCVLVSRFRNEARTLYSHSVL